MSPAARRAAGLVALALVLAVTCGLLGRWQWNRHIARTGVIAQIENSYGADPDPLADLLATPAATLADDDVWRPVRDYLLTGSSARAGTSIAGARTPGSLGNVGS